jgi:hypothetical protein
MLSPSSPPKDNPKQSKKVHKAARNGGFFNGIDKSI